MNSSLVILLSLLCCSAVMAGYGRRYYSTGYKTHLGGSAYGYRPYGYAAHGLSHGLAYSKPVYRPVVYASKAISKPYVTHYVKPDYHHAPAVYHSKPVYSLGGHAYSYKPVSHGYHGYHGYASHPVAYKGYHHY